MKEMEGNKSNGNMFWTVYVDVLNLDKRNCVIILTNKIIFLSDASEDERKELVAKEKEELIIKI